MAKFFESIKKLLFGDDDETGYTDDYELTSSTEKSSSPRTNPDKQNKVQIVNTTTQLEVVLVKPERFDDATDIADHLNLKHTVVLNLESTNKDVSRRLVDFLMGVAYANRGSIKRVANSTFIITPYNIGIVGDLTDELENSGVYF